MIPDIIKTRTQEYIYGPNKDDNISIILSYPDSTSSVYVQFNHNKISQIPNEIFDSIKNQHPHASEFYVLLGYWDLEMQTLFNDNPTFSFSHYDYLSNPPEVCLVYSF